MNEINNDNLHFNISYVFSERGKSLYDILKEHFILYLMELEDIKNI